VCDTLINIDDLGFLSLITQGDLSGKEDEGQEAQACKGSQSESQSAGLGYRQDRTGRHNPSKAAALEKE